MPNPYNLNNMIAYMRTILDEPTAAFFTNAQLTVYINNAIRDIVSTSGCVRVVTPAVTVVDQRTVSYTGNKVSAVEYVPKSGNGRFLPYILPVQLNHVKVDGEEPQYWFDYEGTIGIEPIPDDVYSLNLYIESPPTVLVNIGDLPTMPRAFMPLIILKALQQAYISDSKDSPAVQMLSIYENELGFNIVDKLAIIPDGTLDLRFE